jgi:hypothetical protein
MSNCGRIASGVLRNCDTPLVGGTSDELILINYDDIVSYTENGSNSQVIEGINLVSSPAAQAYLFQGFKNSTEAQIDLAPSAFLNGWKHQVLFRIFDNNPNIKQIIDGLANGTYVAIVKNNNQGVNGNGVYELYGRFVGLELTVASSVKNDVDTQGAYVLTLATSDNEKEPKLPASVFLTDLATTKALVESLYS